MMTAKELRTEINKILIALPEEQLEFVYQYLKEIQGISNANLAKAINIRKILVEDREVLKKLAE